MRINATPALDCLAGLAGLYFVALFLVSCDSQPPREVSEIHAAAKARITYENYSAYDYRYIPRDAHGTGNCATFAYTVWVDLNAAGKPAVMTSCTTEGDTRHVYVRSGKWALDVRFMGPVTVDRLKCI